MHLHHSKQQNKSQKLMTYSYPSHKYFSLDHQTISGDYNDDIQAVELNRPINDYRIPVPVLTTIAGSVNGLVCISYITDWDKSSTILVWNPTTRVHKILPPHPVAPVTRLHGIGFGYNSTADDYNIVRVVDASGIDICSLKTNSWKLVMHGKGIPGHSVRFQNRFRVCSTDGLIYWLACHTPPLGGILKDQFIACFDLKEVDDDDKKKLIREIPMPPDFDAVYGFAELKVLGGCLNVFIVGIHFKSLKMWTMMKMNKNKNDQVEYRWINRVMIREASFLMHDIWSGRYVVPICLSKDGKIVLRIPNNTPSELVLYDSDSKSIKNLHPIHWIPEIGICTGDKVPIEEFQMYIETLVSPNL